jgi:hypothetical protein
MTQQTTPGVPHPQVESRRSRLLGVLGRPATPVRAGGTPLPRGRVQYLLREAEELYWNELAWEELTEEERISGGHLTELVFPGFLAFVDGLLLEPGEARSPEGSGPHPEVVEEVLLFLAERLSSATEELGRGADSENLVWARAMTAHLIDLVLYRLYDVSDEEREDLEARA